MFQLVFELPLAAELDIDAFLAAAPPVSVAVVVLVLAALASALLVENAVQLLAVVVLYPLLS